MIINYCNGNFAFATYRIGILNTKSGYVKYDAEPSLRLPLLAGVKHHFFLCDW